jgi:uncharacterized membrane protein YdbT with pleckstrin-like domain
MPYPRRLLNEGEEIALDLRPHWWFFSRNVLTGIPLFVLAVLLVSWSTGSGVKDFAAWVWLVLLVAWVVWLVLQYFSWQFTQFVVTNRRVIYRTGVVRRRGVEIPLGRVNNINFSQGVWERVIGAGDLVIESAGTDGASRFTNVRHPDGVQHEIHHQMEEYERRNLDRLTGAVTSSQAGAQADTDIASQISRLADLRDRGAITEAEFAAKKSELLDRM